MEPIVTILAILGFVCVMVRFLRASFSFIRRQVIVFHARKVADVRARRGDLTGMAEAERRVEGARRARWRSLAWSAFWFALLAVPPMLPWTRGIYASYSALWLLRGVGGDRF
jgi:hypothetical protein